MEYSKCAVISILDKPGKRNSWLDVIIVID